MTLDKLLKVGGGQVLVLKLYTEKLSLLSFVHVLNKSLAHLKPRLEAAPLARLPDLSDLEAVDAV